MENLNISDFNSLVERLMVRIVTGELLSCEIERTYGSKYDRYIIHARSLEIEIYQYFNLDGCQVVDTSYGFASIKHINGKEIYLGGIIVDDRLIKVKCDKRLVSCIEKRIKGFVAEKKRISDDKEQRKIEANDILVALI